MIRDFNIEDLEGFDHLGVDDVLPIAWDDPSVEYYTLLDGAVPVAFIIFRQVKPDDWAGFFILSKLFKPLHSREIKQFIERTVSFKKPKRLWTLSKKNSTLDRWHKFLDMSIESTQEINNAMYNLWSIRWA